MCASSPGFARTGGIGHGAMAGSSLRGRRNRRGGTDFAALEDRIRATADAVYAIFKDIIEIPASESEKENNQ